MAALLREAADLTPIEDEGKSRFHVGFWLTVYDATGLDPDSLQAALDRRVGEVLEA